MTGRRAGSCSRSPQCLARLCYGFDPRCLKQEGNWDPLEETASLPSKDLQEPKSKESHSPQDLRGLSNHFRASALLAGDEDGLPVSVGVEQLVQMVRKFEAEGIQHPGTQVVVSR